MRTFAIATTFALAAAAPATIFQPGEAPRCFVSGGRTIVEYSAQIHPSFKCAHSGAVCKCTAKHPTHHTGGCMQMDHTDGTKLSVSGDCSKTGHNPGGKLIIKTTTSGKGTFSFADQGKLNGILDKSFVYEQKGFKVTLAGWTHARPYADGFLRNKNGEGTATVSNLVPGAGYKFKVFQNSLNNGLAITKRPAKGVDNFPNAPKGASGFSINGVAQPDTITILNSKEPTATGVATAKADGSIVFAFDRKKNHVDLSGIEIKKDGVTSFNDKGNVNGLKDSEGKYVKLKDMTLEYEINDGYVAKLSGWTHTRDYAGGYLRNKAGDGTAVVSGLKPGAQYKFHVYQFDSSGMSFGKKALGHVKGANGFSVNGVDQDDTITLNSSTAPTVSGLATANADGTIDFAFTRKQHHVNLSGLSVHLAIDAVAPAKAIDLTNFAEVNKAYLAGELVATKKASSADECTAPGESYFYCQQPGSSTDNYDYCGNNYNCPVNSVHAQAWTADTLPGARVDGNCCYCGGCVKTVAQQ